MASGTSCCTRAPSTPAISSTSPGHGARHPRRHRPAGGPAGQRYHPYRLYDYDRLQNGKPCALHIQQSKDVIQSPYEAPTLTQKSRCTPDYDWEELVRSPYFTLSHVRVYDHYEIWMDEPFAIVNVLSGSGTINGEPIRQGESLILPFGTGKVSVEGTVEIAVSSLTIS